ncbi:MAG: patatin-like phospholipase family protein [Cyclobacteriaceae bacterium]|jgi:NTE family protein|tara:strand:- start:460 stop:933 length:474 start_codon:yes stop_codon:yes gene_type:complete
MKRKVSLVLSSGGSRGLAHIGAINELEKQGFEIYSISGSSIGAVVGGLHAMGKLPEYTYWVKTINRPVIWGLLDFAFSTSGLLKGDKVFDKMKTFIPDMNIEEMSIPFAAVATDLLNEREMIFKSGSFYEAIRASVAIPTVFTPVMYKNLLLVDGGY